MKKKKKNLRTDGRKLRDQRTWVEAVSVFKRLCLWWPISWQSCWVYRARETRPQAESSLVNSGCISRQNSSQTLWHQRYDPRKCREMIWVQVYDPKTAYGKKSLTPHASDRFHPGCPRIRHNHWQAPFRAGQDNSCFWGQSPKTPKWNFFQSSERITLNDFSSKHRV